MGKREIMFCDCCLIEGVGLSRRTAVSGRQFDGHKTSSYEVEVDLCPECDKRVEKIVNMEGDAGDRSVARGALYYFIATVCSQKLQNV